MPKQPKQPKPVTSFAEPPFALVPDTEWRLYANVDNRAGLFYPDRVDEHGVHVVVPTELFTLMKDVLKIAPDAQICLSFTIEGAFATFSLFDTLTDNEYDLWSYTAATLPAFLQPYITLDES